MEQSSCTEDRIRHGLECCLTDLGLSTPHKQIWKAGLCINRWCLEELVKRDSRNFLILLHAILRKTKEVLEQCQYEQVVPLTLLFYSTLLKAPYLAPDFGVLQEASSLFQRFLSWPDPCCSASKRLLTVIHHELRAPGISFQRLVRSEQGISLGIHTPKTITVFLVNSDEDVPPEFLSVSEQLGATNQSTKDVTVTLLLHSFQAVLGVRYNLRGLHDALQTKKPEELEKLLETVTNCMETAASSADFCTAREGLRQAMEQLREGLVLTIPNGNSETGTVEMFTLPFPKCHTCSWESDNFDFLHDILTKDSDLDLQPDTFVKSEMDEVDDSNDTGVDEKYDAEENKDILSHGISSTSSYARDSNYFLTSSWPLASTTSGSSGVESDFSEDTGQEDAEEGQGNQPKPRKKPKKKSRSLLGVERLSIFFKSPRSPILCRRAQSMGFSSDFTHDPQHKRSRIKHSKHHQHTSPRTSQGFHRPQRHVCSHKRPILSCSEADGTEVETLARVVVFGGDREAGRLARAYSELQQKESRCPRLSKTCHLQFYFVPTRRRRRELPGEGRVSAEGQLRTSSKATGSVASSGITQGDGTTDISQMLGMMDPWYERNVVSLLNLSPDILRQTATASESSSTTCLPLMADLVLYYCRHAEQPVLVQLYQAEMTLAGGERRSEVFIQSAELGHTAATRAVKAMGVASKRFGIDEEREAVPLHLNVAYNKVAISGRSRWMESEMVCTSINLYKACREPEQLDSTTESLWLTMTEVLKRQCSKSKMGYNQHFSICEVKVDRVQVTSGVDGTTFAVCLDQDEKKFIQSVTRFEVSLCCKPESMSDWRSYKHSPGQVQPMNLPHCSLLCLPIISFSALDP